MSKEIKTEQVNQDRAPERGRENYAMAVASGECAFCGWNEAVSE